MEKKTNKAFLKNLKISNSIKTVQNPTIFMKNAQK